MSEQLKNYLVQIAFDLERLDAFISDPMKAAAESGLSEDDQSILFSGDQNRIYAAIAAPPASTQPTQQQNAPSESWSQPIAYLSPWGQWIIYIMAAPQSLGVQSTQSDEPSTGPETDATASTTGKQPRVDDSKQTRAPRARKQS